MDSILAEDRNCWRITRAGRAAFIIDGEDYFRAVREAMCRAQHAIFIVGWDLHSELRLVRDGEDDGYPQTLAPLLDRLAEEQSDLHIYILDWDFAMIYAMEREFFPRYRLDWKSHRRVHFCFDSEHPVGASQHQKIVVIDDRIAFSGGLDLSAWRWDTSAHAVDDARRTDPEGDPYPPFHDVQMLVDGEAAAALSDLVRDRWASGGGPEPVARRDSAHDPWPEGIEPVLQDVEVGIARTLPAYAGRDEVREVERLYLDSIAAATDFIYIENQYFSSHRVGQALAERLEEPDGPEVVIVMPEKTGGWLEQHTMDVLRARLLRRLRESDRHDRLRLYYVRLATEPHVSLMVHAKVMIIDDRFARVASSNLSNRSMGLDSECDLAVESKDGQDCHEAIAGFRRRLLAEHLGGAVEAVAEAEARTGSLIQAIESLRGGERSLEPLSGAVSAEVDEWVPESALLDPEKPVEPDELFDYIVSPEQQTPAYRYLLRVGLLILGVLGMAAAWRWTPLSDWLDVERVAAVGHWIKSTDYAPLLVLGAYVIGGLAVVPVTLMIIATVTVFGPWQGAGYALVGSELSAVVTFGVGHLLGRDTISRVAGSRVNRLSRTLSSRGVLTILTLRIVPVAPFTVINVIAGVSDIRFRDFAIGTLIGMLPGIIAIAFLADRIVASLRDPSAASIVILIAAVAVVILGLIGLRHWIRHKRGQRAQASGDVADE